MNDKTRHLTEGVRKFSPLLQAFEAGYSIEQIRASVHQTLEPEFKNPAVLQRYGIDLLTVEATNISKVKLQPETYALYAACIEVHTSLLLRDPDRCAKICSYWEQEIGAGLHLYWNSARFEVDKSGLPLDEFAFEVLRNIGSLLEATMQPYLRELLHLSLQGDSVSQTKEAIAALDFGGVVTRLEAGRLGNLLRPKPFDIALNQWRNIAQHFAVKIDGTAIVCTYGRGGRHTVTFNRSELWNALASLMAMHLAIRTAHTIFFLDHGDALAVHCKGYARKDSDLQFQFLVGAASQGFEVTDLSVTPECSAAHFQDVTGGEATPRGIHASQFVVNLWEATRSALLKITYSTKAGVTHLWAQALAEDCERVAKGEKDMRYLAKVVKLSLTKPDEAPSTERTSPRRTGRRL